MPDGRHFAPTAASMASGQQAVDVLPGQHQPDLKESQDDPNPWHLRVRRLHAVRSVL